jgi:hypothetical protein
MPDPFLSARTEYHRLQGVGAPTLPVPHALVLECGCGKESSPDNQRPDRANPSTRPLALGVPGMHADETDGSAPLAEPCPGVTSRGVERGGPSAVRRAATGQANRAAASGQKSMVGDSEGSDSSMIPSWCSSAVVRLNYFTSQLVSPRGNRAIQIQGPAKHFTARIAPHDPMGRVN